MSQSGQDNQVQGVLQIILYIGFGVLAMHLYFFCYDFLTGLGYTHPQVDGLVIRLNRSTHLLTELGTAKLVAGGLLALYAYGCKAKKSLTVTWLQVGWYAGIGGLLFLANGSLLYVTWFTAPVREGVYAATTLTGYLMLLGAGTTAKRIVRVRLDGDPFNEENESFQQDTRLRQNEYSVNIPTKFNFQGRERAGWVNVVNPFRATLVLGTPGSGKTFAIINNFIRQHLEKGFAMFIYDFKYPDLTTVAYNYFVKYQGNYKVRPTFYILDFDNPRQSHRCNPMTARQMTDIADAQELARTILLNLNKTWIAKTGDFFVESPINFLAAVIWFLKRYNDRQQAEIDRQRAADPTLVLPDANFCTFPHAIELANQEYEALFPLLLAERELENLARPFASALKKGAFDQLEGQVASARLPLGRLASPTLYWMLTGNDFTLDINNPAEPKIVCVGNNEARSDVYGAALGLYNTRMLKLVNQKKKLKTSLIIDELPTIFFRGLERVINTARQNKVSTCLSVQDLSQLKKEYGDKEATVIFNTMGNLFAGQVLNETAKLLSARFGKNVQRRQSFNFSERETTMSISTSMDALIPESKISELSTGSFVGAVADTFEQRIKKKTFHSEFVVSPAQMAEEANFEPIPPFSPVATLDDAALNDLLDANFRQVKTDIDELVTGELARIRADPNLSHLVTDPDPDEDPE